VMKKRLAVVTVADGSTSCGSLDVYDLSLKLSALASQFRSHRFLWLSFQLLL